MVLDLLVFGSAWAGLAMVLGWLTHLPWPATAFAALAALLAHDWLVERSGRGNATPEQLHQANQPATVQSVTPFLKSLMVLVVFGLAPLAGLFAADLYLEAGGARLALPNFAWPRELRALFALVGLSADSFSFPTLIGILISVASIGAPLVIVDLALKSYGNVARFVATVRTRGTDGEVKWSELLNLALPLVLVVFVSLLFYGQVFPRWSYPLAKLQIAHALWKAEFTPRFAAGTLSEGQVTTPDLQAVLDAHAGQFSATLVTAGPVGLLFLHLLVALVAELFLHQTIQSARPLEQRQRTIFHMMRLAVLDLFAWVLRRERAAVQPPGEVAALPAALGAPAAAADTPAPDSAATGAPAPQREATDEEGTLPEEELDLEDRPVRVEGTTECLPPREARRMPDSYQVELVTNAETGEQRYRITLARTAA
jgi:hypothetical protein